MLLHVLQTARLEIRPRARLPPRPCRWSVKLARGSRSFICMRLVLFNP